MIPLIIQKLAFIVLVAFSVSLSLPRTSAQIRPPDRGRTHPDDEHILAFAFSPDGKILAIARGVDDSLQQSGRIELWDTETGNLVHEIKGFDGPVWSVSFSPNGETLVSASTELHDNKIQEKPGHRDARKFGELKWWDAKTGEFKQKIRLAGDGRASVTTAYSPDGKLLGTVESFFQFGLPTNYVGFRGLYPGLELKLLDANTGELKTKLRGGHVSELERFNWRTMQIARLSGVSPGRPRPIVFSPTGATLAEWQYDWLKLLESKWTARAKDQDFEWLAGRRNIFARRKFCGLCRRMSG